MGWTIYYQVLRDAPLTAAEQVTLASFALERRRWDWDSEPLDLRLSRTPRADGVLAHGMTKVSMEAASSDAEQVVRCLNDLVGLLPGARLLVDDDLGLVGRDGGRISVGGEACADELVEHDDDDAFVEATKLVPPPKRRAVATPDDAGARLARLVALDDPAHPEAERLVAELARSDGDAVVAAALRAYRKLSKSWWMVSAAVDDAARRASDPARHAPAFLDLWRKGRGTYWHADLLGVGDALVAAVVQAPAVETAMRDELTGASPTMGTEGEHRRAGAAAKVLALATSDGSLAALLTVLRDARDSEVSFGYTHHVLYDALEGVAKRGDARAFATLALELGRMSSDTQAHARAAAALVVTDPARGERLALRVAALHLFPAELARALGGGASPESEAVLERTLADPFEHVRCAAAEALTRRRGAEVEAPAPAWDPLTDLTHPREDVRHRALSEVASARCAHDVLALALASALDERLQGAAHHGSYYQPLSWDDWGDALPRDVRRLRPAPFAAWAMQHAAATLGEQWIPDQVAPLLEQGVEAVAATYATPLFRLPDDERAAYEREERDVLARLRDT